ncbi:regulator of microtubule dynamics protein 2-like isoform X1 [Lates japonicus]|uniref:Regulator of microtubule dynamics protein 2-like isoform X1 n=1 Tax=Lates japonicus TaxID=270547 RepID=A0AAD3QYE1_LATJO|nr:regulator of microtubule dynamics protein 2-like isoform X1 [Lates japonicus]
MVQSDSKVLVSGEHWLEWLGSVWLWCVTGLQVETKSLRFWFYLSRSNEHSLGLMLVDGPGLPVGQAEVLDRLEALIQCVSELKDQDEGAEERLPIAGPGQGGAEGTRLSTAQPCTGPRPHGRKKSRSGHRHQSWRPSSEEAEEGGE